MAIEYRLYCGIDVNIIIIVDDIQKVRSGILIINWFGFVGVLNLADTKYLKVRLVLLCCEYIKRGFISM